MKILMQILLAISNTFLGDKSLIVHDIYIVLFILSGERKRFDTLIVLEFSLDYTAEKRSTGL